MPTQELSGTTALVTGAMRRLIESVLVSLDGVIEAAGSLTDSAGGADPGQVPASGRS
jgi:hypothetical protein